MKNKKGLSDVVTNVLIILLVVVAVGILWAFVGPLFRQSGEKAQQQTICLQMTLDPMSCVKSLSETNVTVKRSAGTANLKELRLIFQKEDGSTKVEKIDTNLPGELETKLYTITSLGWIPIKVSVAGGIANEKGDVNYCVESQPINC